MNNLPLFGPNVHIAPAPLPQPPQMNPQQIAHANLLQMMGPEAAFNLTHMNEFRDRQTIPQPKKKGKKVKKKLFGNGSKIKNTWAIPPGQVAN